MRYLALFLAAGVLHAAELPEIDAATLAKWSAPYCGWHYQPIPAMQTMWLRSHLVKEAGG